MPVTLNGNGQVPVQVISTTKTDTFISSVTNAWTNITGLSVNITPTNSANRVFINVMLSSGAGGNNFSRGLRVTRNGTAVAVADSGTGISGMTGAYQVADGAMISFNISALDSPATTSVVTYQVQFFTPAPAVTGMHVNKPYVSDANSFLGVSTITVMEISG